MSQSIWVRLNLLDNTGENEAVLVSASSKEEAEGKTELVRLEARWLTPALGPIIIGTLDESSASRINAEAKRLIENHMKKVAEE